MTIKMVIDLHNYIATCVDICLTAEVNPSHHKVVVKTLLPSDRNTLLPKVELFNKKSPIFVRLIIFIIIAIIKRHDTVCAQLHFNICTEIGVKNREGTLA
jgi:hypothetical protein